MKLTLEQFEALAAWVDATAEDAVNRMTYAGARAGEEQAPDAKRRAYESLVGDEPCGEQGK